MVLNLPWPKGAKTLPVFEARARYEFEADRARCLALVKKVPAGSPEETWSVHPVLGRMTGRGSADSTPSTAINI
jgi:hypothetical protein